jgi:hypothetical protein
MKHAQVKNNHLRRRLVMVARPERYGWDERKGRQKSWKNINKIQGSGYEKWKQKENRKENRKIHG